MKYTELQSPAPAFLNYRTYTSVQDPDQYDPYVFEPLKPASGKVSQTLIFAATLIIPLTVNIM